MGIKWRTHTTALLVLGVMAIIIASAVAFMLTTFQPTVQVSVGSGSFEARVADTNESRQKGLSGTPALRSNQAMLFDFKTEDKWGIWMKDMAFPIDIIWLDSEKTVVHIVRNAQPESVNPQTYTPVKDARYVLEVAAGAAQSNNIRVGERAVFALESEATE